MYGRKWYNYSFQVSYIDFTIKCTSIFSLHEILIELFKTKGLFRLKFQRSLKITAPLVCTLFYTKRISKQMIYLKQTRLS